MEAINERYNRLTKAVMDHVENGTTDWAEDIMTVPATEYTDPTFFDAEMDAIFKKLPVLVACSGELPNAGDFKTLDFLKIPLLITRQSDGSVKVLLNVCTHRAMTLTQEACGNKRIFTCPYHAWSFGNDGRLRGVAEAAKFGADCRGGSHDLVEFPCHEEGGLIFAVLNPESTLDIRESLSGMMDDVVTKGIQNWTYVGNRPIHGANWKVAFDGYLEGYHFAAAHAETIHPRSFSNIMEFELAGHHMYINFPQRGVLKLRDVPEEDLYKHENDGYDFIRMFFPNVSIFVAPEITMISQIIPGPAYNENTTVLHFVHPEPAKDEEEEQARQQMADWLRDVVYEEDYKVGLQVQRGLESGHLKNVTFGRNERLNQYFHKMVKYYVDGDMSKAEPQL